MRSVPPGTIPARAALSRGEELPGERGALDGRAHPGVRKHPLSVGASP